MIFARDRRALVRDWLSAVSLVWRLAYYFMKENRICSRTVCEDLVGGRTRCIVSLQGGGVIVLVCGDGIYEIRGLVQNKIVLHKSSFLKI